MDELKGGRTYRRSSALPRERPGCPAPPGRGRPRPIESRDQRIDKLFWGRGELFNPNRGKIFSGNCNKKIERGVTAGGGVGSYLSYGGARGEGDPAAGVRYWAAWGCLGPLCGILRCGMWRIDKKRKEEYYDNRNEAGHL